VFGTVLLNSLTVFLPASTTELSILDTSAFLKAFEIFLFQLTAFFLAFSAL